MSAGRPTHVLITGAAGAIGGALARELRVAWPGVRLALVDLDAARLAPLARELSAAPVSVHGADLRAIDALPGLVAEIATAGPIDGLINCAGVMQVADLAGWAWADADATLALNLLAPLRLQALVVAALGPAAASPSAAWRGTVVNIASMAGRVPLRGCAYYGASKAGLGMASEIARADLAAHGVRVVTVYPGPVASALEQGARAAYGGGGVLGQLAPVGDPRELARRVVAAVRADRARVIYPRAYGVGWAAPALSQWFALAYGPPPAR